jgi:hypothetical protein
MPVKIHGVRVTNASPAKDIQGGPDGEVDSTAPSSSHFFEIRERLGASGVGQWQWGPICQLLDQLRINPAAEPFHIRGVDQELVTKSGQLIENTGAEDHIGEALPTVSDHHVVCASPAAAQVQNEALFADLSGQSVQSLPVQSVVLKDPRGDDNMGSTRLEPGFGIVQIQAAAYLQASRISL